MKTLLLLLLSIPATASMPLQDQDIAASQIRWTAVQSFSTSTTGFMPFYSSASWTQATNCSTGSAVVIPSTGTVWISANMFVATSKTIYLQFSTNSILGDGNASYWSESGAVDNQSNYTNAAYGLTNAKQTSIRLDASNTGFGGDYVQTDIWFRIRPNGASVTGHALTSGTEGSAQLDERIVQTGWNYQGGKTGPRFVFFCTNSGAFITKGDIYVFAVGTN